MQTYFKVAIPALDGKDRTLTPTGRRDPRWKLLGFQDEDPRTDFRGGGLLSLKCLIWMTQLDAQRVAQLIRESSGQGTLSPEYWYPFAAAVINVCFELSNWLLLDQRRANGKVQPDEVCNGLEYRRFAELTVEEPETFLLLATSAVVAMHEEWSSKKYTVMEFRKCVKTAIRRVSNFLSQTSKERSEKALAELRTTWQLPPLVQSPTLESLMRGL